MYISTQSIREAIQKHVQVSHIEEISDEFGFPTEKLFAYVRGENIPSAVLIGTTRINITYPGMERRCRLCEAPDHAAGNCPKRQCYNCNKTDHVSAECKAGCRRYGDSDHTSHMCEGRKKAIDLDSPAAFPSLNKSTAVPKLAELAWNAAGMKA